MLYIGDVWPFSIIHVVLLVFALFDQVSEASEYINEGNFSKRPSGPSTMSTRDLLGFCNIKPLPLPCISSTLLASAIVWCSSWRTSSQAGERLYGNKMKPE